MTPFILWYCLTKENQKLLRHYLSVNWQPPLDWQPPKSVKKITEMENVEEIDRLMREKPKSKRESTW